MRPRLEPSAPSADPFRTHLCSERVRGPCRALHPSRCHANNTGTATKSTKSPTRNPRSPAEHNPCVRRGSYEGEVQKTYPERPGALGSVLPPLSRLCLMPRSQTPLFTARRKLECSNATNACRKPTMLTLALTPNGGR